MLTVDTNVLVRFLTADDANFRKRAGRLTKVPVRAP